MSKQIFLTNVCAPFKFGNSFINYVTRFAGIIRSFTTSIDGSFGIGTFYGPLDCTLDTNGNVYVLEYEGKKISKVGPFGAKTTIKTLATKPTGIAYYTDFNVHEYLFYSEGTNLYTIDMGGNVINTMSLPASVNKMVMFGIDLYATLTNYTVVKIGIAYSPPTFSTIAGSAGQSQVLDGTAYGAKFIYPNGIAVDSSGNIYVAESSTGHCIRKISPPNWVVTTIAGQPGVSGYADGVGSNARFNRPEGITIDSSGNLYVTDVLNYSVRKITNGTWKVGTFIGNGAAPAETGGLYNIIDGPASSVGLVGGCSIQIDQSGNFYITEYDVSIIRKLTPLIDTTPAAGTYVYSGSRLTNAIFVVNADKTTLYYGGALYNYTINTTGKITLDNNRTAKYTYNTLLYSEPFGTQLFLLVKPVPYGCYYAFIDGQYYWLQLYDGGNGLVYCTLLYVDGVFQTDCTLGTYGVMLDNRNKLWIAPDWYSVTQNWFVIDFNTNIVSLRNPNAYSYVAFNLIGSTYNGHYQGEYCTFFLDTTMYFGIDLNGKVYFVYTTYPIFPRSWSYGISSPSADDFILYIIGNNKIVSRSQLLASSSPTPITISLNVDDTTSFMMGTDTYTTNVQTAPSITYGPTYYLATLFGQIKGAYGVGPIRGYSGTLPTTATSKGGTTVKTLSGAGKVGVLFYPDGQSVLYFIRTSTTPYGYWFAGSSGIFAQKASESDQWFYFTYNTTIPGYTVPSYSAVSSEMKLTFNGTSATLTLSYLPNLFLVTGLTNPINPVTISLTTVLNSPFTLGSATGTLPPAVPSY